jgi:hypothetical protein
MTVHVGEILEVRSKEEILALLDKNGRTEGMPFMPEMLEHCGKRLRVSGSAHKSCDTVKNPGKGISLPGGVHLEGSRCTGAGHGGCQAGCLIFWKEAWLKPVAGGRPSQLAAAKSEGGCTEADVQNAAYGADSKPDSIRYSCQATELPNCTTVLPYWDARQYVQDYLTGNASLWKIISSLIYAGYSVITQANRPKWGVPFRAVYDVYQSLRGGIAYPSRPGKLADGTAGPLMALDLRPGEFVRVKTHQQILETLTVKNRHRGMGFDAEIVPFCGKTYRVLRRIETFIDEHSGKIRHMKTPAVILENVWCGAHYAKTRLFCRRAIYIWFREAWLERVAEPTTERAEQSAVATVRVLETA